MDLAEARARKAALLAEAARSLDAMSAEPGAGAGAMFVGIVPSRSPDGYRIAVRLTGDEPQEPVARVEAARTAAGADADVRFVGRVMALVTDPGPPPPADPPRTDPSPTDPPPPDAACEEPTAGELQQRTRPLVRGVSVAHVDVTAGTIGGFVTIGAGDAAHVLSNNHVLAATGRGRPGDAVLQPGPADRGGEDDRVGELVTAVALDPGGRNLVDAAVASLDDDVEVDAAAHDGQVTTVVEPDAVEGYVRKIGRTTGVTRGRISAFEVDGVPVGYDTGVFTFDDQIEVEGVIGAFGAGGDSGSLITTEGEPAGVGLLFAGSTTGGPRGTGITYANRLANVLAALDARLLGATDEPEEPAADDGG